MKKISKIVALVLCISLSTVLFAGCGSKDETKATTDGKNFTYWAVMDSYSTRTLDSYNDMLFYQEMEKRTGVHIDFIHPIEGSTGNEAFIAMLTGEKIPDMIEYEWEDYTGGPQQALDDDVIIALDDYLKDHAPAYYDYMEGEKGKQPTMLSSSSPPPVTADTMASMCSMWARPRRSRVSTQEPTFLKNGVWKCLKPSTTGQHSLQKQKPKAAQSLLHVTSTHCHSSLPTVMASTLPTA